MSTEIDSSADSPSSTPLPPPPIINEETAPFWNSAREHALRLPKCVPCGKFFFPPAQLCPFCWNTEISYELVAGTGSVLSFVTFQRLYHPAFASLLPYDVGVVQLDEGPRLLSRILGRESGSPPEVSSPLIVCYDDISEAVTLPLFRVVGPNPSDVDSMKETV